MGTHTVGKWLSFTVTLPSAASVKKGTKGRFTNASSVAASAMCLEVMEIKGARGEIGVQSPPILPSSSPSSLLLVVGHLLVVGLLDSHIVLVVLLVVGP